MKSPERSLITAAGLVLLIALVAFTDSVVTEAQREPRRVTIEWPSPEFRTLQSAIDAAPDRATVQIKRGVHRISEPVFVRGKALVIEGAGSGGDRTPRVMLVGPSPRPVVDREGNMLLRAEAVQGMFNCVAAEVFFRHMMITGFDAGIVSKNGPDGSSAPIRVEDMVIVKTGRGVLSLSNAAVTIKNLTTKDTLWNGISVKAQGGVEPPINIKASFIGDPEGIGMYFENTDAFVSDVSVIGAQEGGIVLFQSGGFIVDSILHSNRRYGIAVVESPDQPIIQGNIVINTTTKNSEWGFGIFVVLSTVNVFGNWSIDGVTGVWNAAGTATLGDNSLQCNDIDLVGIVFNGQNYQFIDIGGNGCGCPQPIGSCQADSNVLVPPDFDAEP